MRTLVIEREPLAKAVFTKLLGVRGYTVTDCEELYAAIAEINSQSFDIIIIGSGFDRGEILNFCRWCRSYRHAAPVYIWMVAATQDPSELKEILACGANDYLFPPITEHYLELRLAVAEQLVQGQRQNEYLQYQLKNLDFRYQTLLAGSSDAVVMLDARGQLRYASPSVYKILGYSSEELPSVSGRQLVHPDEEAVASKAAQKILEVDSGTVRGEFRCLHKNGSWIWLETTIQNLLNVPGLESVIVHARDISGRKEAEDLLRRSESQFRSLFENAPVGIVISRRETLLFVNPAVAKMFGYGGVEELNGGSLINIIAPSHRSEMVERVHHRALGKTVPNSYESAGQRKDGTLFPFHVEVARVSLADGPATFAFLVDVTERKSSEAENRKLAAFARYNPNPVLEFSEDGELHYFNEATGELARKLGQEDPRSILPEGTTGIVRSCLKTGRKYLRLETIIRERTLSWSFYPITASRVVHCYAGDITDKLNLEGQLRQSQKMESVGQLAAGVAHDFNNILTVIQGFTGLLLTETFDIRKLEALHQIHDAAERAANLTRQLLTFSRKQVLQPRQTDLNALINNVTRMLRRILGEQMTLQCELRESLPSVYADGGMIEQVLINLAINARDAMPKGGFLTIQTQLTEIGDTHSRKHHDARQGEFVQLRVSDTGKGMDPVTLSRIFEPFFTTKEIGKGTGLGLATVYGIIKQHDGWIEVHSQVEEGTRFDIYLPPSTIASREMPSLMHTAPGLNGSETILVVEDEISLRKLACEILKRHQYNVLEAANGPEAVDVWNKNRHKIDLLLTDMVMPGGLSGKELAQLIIREDPKIRVIITSGYSPESVRLEGEFASHFLPKPYNPIALLAALRNALDEDQTEHQPSLPFSDHFSQSVVTSEDPP